MRTAVILFNLGGPDGLAAVRPFLFQLFHDRAIIDLPQPFRYAVAKLISALRAEKARAIYAQMGGKSPIREETQAQAQALEKMLGEGYRVFTCMRYWHPRASEVAQQVKAYQPDEIILLPLYPQYSTSTTASSFREWHEEAKKAGLAVPTRSVCCYSDEPHFIASHVARIREAGLHEGEKIRLLFSAHGLPEKTIRAGDPYQWQVEKTVAAVVEALQKSWRSEATTPRSEGGKGGDALAPLDHAICYQSRVGPLKWLGPSIDQELQRAAQDGVGVMVVPVSFVSEHSETLVELDIDYRARAKALGIKTYIRVPALGLEPSYIEALAQLARNAGGCSWTRGRLCPPQCGACGCADSSFRSPAK